MKKFVLFIIFLLIVSIGVSINFYNPLGPSLLPAAGMFIENPSDINLNYWRSLDEAQTLMIRNQADFIVLPVSFGVNLINKGLDYKLAGVSLWKTFYMASSIEIEDIEQLNNKRVITIQGPGQTGDLLLRLIEKELNININIVYVQGLAEAVQLLAAGREEIAVLPEPFVSLAEIRTQGEVKRIFDMQEIYADLTGNDPIVPSTGLFLHNSVELNKARRIIEKYAYSTNVFLRDYFDEAVGFVVEAMGGNMPRPAIISAAKNSQIEYFLNKDQVIKYLEFLLNYDFLEFYDEKIFFEMY